MSAENNYVAAVCGSEVRIYGGVDTNGRRPLMQVIEKGNRGQAIHYATEYDDHQRSRQAYQPRRD